MSANEQAQQILNDPAASFWLKDALRSALNRDCVDAAADAQALAGVLNKIAHEAICPHPRRALFIPRGQ